MDKTNAAGLAEVIAEMRYIAPPGGVVYAWAARLDALAAGMIAPKPAGLSVEERKALENIENGCSHLSEKDFEQDVFVICTALRRLTGDTP